VLVIAEMTSAIASVVILVPRPERNSAAEPAPRREGRTRRTPTAHGPFRAYPGTPAVWAGGQVRLRERAGTGMAPEEYQRAAAVITACGGALPDGAVPADQPALPGKRK